MHGALAGRALSICITVLESVALATAETCWASILSPCRVRLVGRGPGGGAAGQGAIAAGQVCVGPPPVEVMAAEGSTACGPERGLVPVRSAAGSRGWWWPNGSARWRPLRRCLAARTCMRDAAPVSARWRAYLVPARRSCIGASGRPGEGRRGRCRRRSRRAGLVADILDSAGFGRDGACCGWPACRWPSGVWIRAIVPFQRRGAGQRSWRSPPCCLDAAVLPAPAAILAPTEREAIAVCPDPLSPGRSALLIPPITRAERRLVSGHPHHPRPLRPDLRR